MKNIAKLVKNTDLSLEEQTNLYYSIERVNEEIEMTYEGYEECKKLFMAADAKLKTAISVGDRAAQHEAAQEISPLVNELHEFHERLKQLEITKQRFYETLMDHQKSNEHSYVSPRRQAKRIC
jgi:DNA-binding protein H-NS